MHHQMGAGDAGVDGLNPVDGEDVAGGRPGELVGAVAGADGDSERIDFGSGDKGRSLFRIRQQHVVAQRTFSAHAVFFPGRARFQGPQAAQLPLHGHATGVGHGRHLRRHRHVVVVIGGGLLIFLERAVHHHGAKAQLDGLLAGRRGGSVILVHAHGNVRELLHRGQNEVAKEIGARVLSGAGGGLNNHRAIRCRRAFHNRAHLLEVIHVKGRNAVAVFRGVIEELSQGN